MNNKTAPFVNLVDEQGNLIVSHGEFDKFILNNSNPKIDSFSVVSIMGGQSGGKSTLLNYLFDTNFPILPPGERKATTKGIMISFAQKREDNLMIMDLEGSDSVEKNESEGETFSRKSALFALAVSEILLVNVWSHDLGKRSAMNLTILKSIFEVNLSMTLTASRVKTKIIFVVRDFDNKIHGHLDNIEKMVELQMKTLWDSLEKKDCFKNSKYNDFFDFTIVAIPHKEYQKSRFLKVIFYLKERFQLKSEKCFFTKENHGEKTKEIPKNALFEYFKSIWSTILRCEELNIISQKESLTSSLCDKYAEEILAESLQKISVEFKNPNPKKFGKTADEIIISARESYFSKAFPSKANLPSNVALFLNNTISFEKLNSVENSAENSTENSILEIRLKKCAALEKNITAKLLEIQAKIIRELEGNLPGIYKNALKKHLENTEILSKFIVLIDECRKSVLNDFNIVCEGLMIKNIGKQTEMDEKRLMQRFAEIDAEMYQKVMEILKIYVEGKVKEKIINVRNALRTTKEGKIWKSVFDCRIEIHSHVQVIFETFVEKNELEKVKNFDVKNAHLFLHSIVIENVGAEILRFKDGIDNELYRRFKNCFKFDKNGIPRNWYKENIEKCWHNAKLTALAALTEYKKFEDFENEEFPPLKVPKAGEYLADSEIVNAKKSLEQQSIQDLKEAQAIQNMSKTKIPLWLIVLLIILGFDEFIYFLKNPLLLILLSAIIYFIWAYYKNNNIFTLLSSPTDILNSNFYNAIFNQNSISESPTGVFGENDVKIDEKSKSDTIKNTTENMKENVTEITAEKKME